MLRYPSKEGLNGEVASPRAIQHPVSRAVRKPVRSPGLSLCLLRSHRGSKHYIIVVACTVAARRLLARQLGHVEAPSEKHFPMVA